MTLTEAMNSIESLKYNVYANIASSEKIFLKCIIQSEEYQLIKKMIELNSDNATIILNSALNLLDTPTDNKYVNIYDVSIATYLYLLKETNIKPIIEKINNSKNLFWVDKLVRLIFKN